MLPDDSGSVLLDDTSSQWSASADTEEEKRNSLEKSMYVFYLLKDPNTEFHGNKDVRHFPLLIGVTACRSFCVQ